MTDLPPGISYLRLTHCLVGAAQLPDSCRLSSLQMYNCAGATSVDQKYSNTIPIKLLDWLEACRLLDIVQVRRSSCM